MSEATAPSRTRLYQVWSTMIRRCHDPRSNRFSYYGARGIAVCDEWRTFPPFQAWAAQSGYQRGLSIERIDNDGNYCPENCRWATQAQQRRNARHTINLTIWGETKCLADWVSDSRCAVQLGTLQYRVHQGWPAEHAVTTPARYGNRQP